LAPDCGQAARGKALDFCSMAHHNDEEVANLLEERPPIAPERQPVGALRKALFASALLGAAGATVAWDSHGKSKQASVKVAGGFQEKASVVGDVGLEPHQALEKNEQRQRLIVEQDLKAILHEHVSASGRQAHKSFKHAGGDKEGAQVCYEQAARLFDEVITASKMDAELHTSEHSAFKDRFVLAMTLKCKDLISERLWIEEAGKELEQQKPVMTSAVSASLNGADLGFQTKMHDWLVHESVTTFSSRLGALPTPDDQKDVLKRKAPQRQAENLPLVFRAETKWPECSEEILKIHNQGHCGSCWAFGGLASVDARMCIASGGNWDAPQNTLSRLHVTSCAPDNYWQGHDGCQGGFPHWPMEMMAKTGVVSTSCLPYYISGEGTEHFEHQDTAPPCETHCQNGYSLPIEEDGFSSAGAANYIWLTHVHGDPTKIGTMKTAIFTEGPVAFAFFANHEFMGYHSGVFGVCTGHDRANHAVYAFGWGVVPNHDGSGTIEYVEASNSWGTNWGNSGHFRIHPRCITDVTIPGTIEGGVVSHSVGTMNTSVPRDDTNPVWPWPQPAECPSDEQGCVTDLEGSGNYTANEKCVSNVLNGKQIQVVEFDMEYGYDVLYVNGVAFSGSPGHRLDIDSLTNLFVDEHGIKFQSDFSMQGAGFKLCPAVPRVDEKD